MRVRILSTAMVAASAAAMAACASVPRHEVPTHERRVFQNVTVEEVRGAALEAVAERTLESRIADDGRVKGESGWSGYWAEYEVRFAEVEGGVAAEVDVDLDRRDRSCGARAQPSFRPTSRLTYGDAFIALEDGGFEIVRAPVATGRNYPVGAGCPDGSKSRARLAERGILDAIDKALRGTG